jgi:phosphatidylglycerophosphate synthase
VSNPGSRRLALRTLTAVFGVGLLIYLVRRVGSENLLQSVVRLGWGLALIIALSGVSHLVRAWAWRMTLTGWRGKTSLLRMLQVRMASEAAGQVGILGHLFGDGLRISAFDESIPIDSRISSVILDRALFIAAGTVVSGVGILAALLVLSLTHALQLYAALFAVTLISLLFLLALAVLKRWRILSRPAQYLGQLQRFRVRVKKALPLIYSVERQLFDFHTSTPGAFWSGLALNLACHGMAVLEVYLVLWLLGVKIGIIGALIFEALTKLVNAVGTFNPGNIGTYEGGNVLIASLLGMTAGVGLAVAVARRLRAIFWAAVGGLFLVMLSRSNEPRDSGDNGTRGSVSATPDTRKQIEAINQSVKAVILANTRKEGDQGQPAESRVGTLPILLRGILSVQKAGARRIIVCIDPFTGPGLQRQLEETGRLPQCIRWLWTASDTPLSQLLREIAADSAADDLILIAGNRTYHPALFRQVTEWNGTDGALTLVTGEEFAGIYALTAEAGRDVAKHCPPEIHNLEELHAWILLSRSVRCLPVPGEMWQRISSPADRISAERKLDRWLVKPTDGVFARMNRRISIPISRQLIKLPITPNMVSLFTLVVGFASGLLFASGGYWNTLAGAVLSVWASILDGCDGEVARLKLLESDFGCWLETICDYLYYLFIFAGMAIGLIRNSQSRTYLVLAVLLLVGAVVSFLVTGLGRQKLSAGRPEDYLRVWQAQAESRRSNPLLYFGRYTEFIIRRCFLPYALLFFALLNITNVAFILSAVGANVVWLISLYTYLTFAVARRSSLKDSAVSA